MSDRDKHVAVVLPGGITGRSGDTPGRGSAERRVLGTLDDDRLVYAAADAIEVLNWGTQSIRAGSWIMVVEEQGFHNIIAVDVD